MQHGIDAHAQAGLRIYLFPYRVLLERHPEL